MWTRPITKHDAAWLAGIFEGMGRLRQNALTVKCHNLSTLNRIARICCGGKMNRVGMTTYAWKLKDSTKMKRILEAVQPHMYGNKLDKTNKILEKMDEKSNRNDS